MQETARLTLHERGESLIHAFCFETHIDCCPCLRLVIVRLLHGSHWCPKSSGRPRATHVKVCTRMRPSNESGNQGVGGTTWVSFEKIMAP